MNRAICLVIVLLVSVSANAQQNPIRFRFTANQTLTYAVTHTTTIRETIADKPLTSTTKLSLTRRWNVQSVDVNGTASVQMLITALKNEITKTTAGADGKPSTETIILDSSNPDTASQVAQFLNKPIVTAKIDARGSVSDVKAVTGDEAAARLVAELPFRVMLPEGVAANWERPFAIKLLPPYGTGESYDAIQSANLRSQTNGVATIVVKTTLKNAPTAPADLQPLLPWLWEGEVQVNAESGHYLGAKLQSNRTLDNHQGVGSKFEFTSEYRETLEK